MKKLTFRQKMFIADVLFYICMTLFFGWIVLKLVGIIKTPLWLTLFPLITAGATFIILTYKIGNYFGRLERNLHFLRTDILRVEKKIDERFDDHIKKYHA